MRQAVAQFQLFTHQDADEELMRKAFEHAHEAHLAGGGRLRQIARHLIGLFHGQPNGRRWRRYLSENAYRKSAGIQTLYEAERLLG